MNIYSSATKFGSRQPSHRTNANTAVASDAWLPDHGGQLDDRPVVLGKQRKARLLPGFPFRKPAKEPTSPRQTPTMGDRAQKRTHRPRGLQVRADFWIKKANGIPSPQWVRNLPHIRRVIAMSEKLGRWWTASRQTEADRKGALEMSTLLRHIDEELGLLDEVKQELLTCLERFSPIWVGDRRALKDTLSELEKRREALLEQKQTAEKVLASHWQVGVDLVQAYSRVGMPINAKTTKIEQVGDGKGVAGKGKVHDVELVDCSRPDPNTGIPRAETKVFKAEPDLTDGTSDVGGALGIDAKEPNLSGRALATDALDKKLGSQLIPHTGFALQNDRPGVLMDWVGGIPPQVTGKVVLPVSKAIADWGKSWPDELQRYAVRKGFSGATVSDSSIEFRREHVQAELDEFGVPRLDAKGQAIAQRVPGAISLPPGGLGKDPVYLARLSDASCLGYLSNQGDWHGGNYMLQSDQDGKVENLQFFDNDLSFGTRSPGTDFDLDAEFGGARATHMTRLPPVITSETYAAVMQLSSDSLAATLKDLVASDDISAAQRRLEVLQLHCMECRYKGLVIDAADPVWGQDVVRQELGIDLLEAARGNLSRLEELEPQLKRANLAARELLAMYLAEARSSAGAAVAPEDAVVFDAEQVRGELSWIAAAAA